MKFNLADTTHVSDSRVDYEISILKLNINQKRIFSKMAKIFYTLGKFQ